MGGGWGTSDERLPFGDRGRVLFSQLGGTQLPLSLGCKQRSWTSLVFRGGGFRLFFGEGEEGGAHNISSNSMSRNTHMALGIGCLLPSLQLTSFASLSDSGVEYVFWESRIGGGGCNL